VQTTRLEAFADGVFAIAATLLILEVRIPEEGDVGQALLDVWPSYAAYAISFLTIGIMWVNHHAVLEHVRGADRAFLFLNLFLLMCIAFVPFPTRLLAEHVGHEGADEAALAYGLTLSVTAVFFNAVWHYAALGRRLLREDASPREVRGISRSYVPGPFMYAGAGLVGLASPDVAVALFAAIALVYVSASIWARDESPFA
jgi:TMEM175 potassium channel family protein